MDPHDLPEDEHAAAWLARSRPEPSDAFLAQLEDRLVPARRRRFALSSRPLIAGLGLSGALAAGVVVVALAGGGTLDGDDDDARAREDCQTTQVRTTEPEGELVRGADGQVRVVTTEKPVTRTVKRCR